MSIWIRPNCSQCTGTFQQLLCSFSRLSDDIFLQCKSPLCPPEPRQFANHCGTIWLSAEGSHRLRIREICSCPLVWSRLSGPKIEMQILSSSAGWCTGTCVQENWSLQRHGIAVAASGRLRFRIKWYVLRSEGHWFGWCWRFRSGHGAKW